MIFRNSLISRNIVADYFQSSAPVSDWSTSTFGSWVTTTFTVDFTAPCDGIVVFNGYVFGKHSAAGGEWWARIYEDTTGLSEESRSRKTNADYWNTMPLNGIAAISAGSHTFVLKIYLNIAGTVSIPKDTKFTRICGIFFKT